MTSPWLWFYGVNVVWFFAILAIADFLTSTQHRWRNMAWRYIIPCAILWPMALAFMIRFQYKRRWRRRV